jgi:hypothetical protein
MDICGRRRAELVTAAVVALAALVPLAGQSDSTPSVASAPNQTWKTPWGDPDLQGSWSNATITPLQRPKQYGSREFLSPEELKANSEARARREQQQPFVSYEEFWYERGGFDGRTSLVFDPPDGQIPYTAEGAKRRAAFLREGFDSWLDRDLYERCIMRNPLPRVPTAYNNNYELVQTPGYVAILQEIMHDIRVIPLDGRPHLDSAVRQWLGDSRGRWEGNTLVVETTNFTDRTDFEGGGPNMRLIERWTRVADDRLDYRFTVEDSTAWHRPWSAAIGWNGVEPLFEYACHEGNRALVNVLQGARVKEAEAAKRALQR